MSEIKITDLPLASSVASTDLVLVVANPSGAATTKKTLASTLPVSTATQTALNDATLPSTGLTITKTGDWARFQPQNFFLTPANAFQMDQQSGTSVYTKYTGKFLGASYSYSEASALAGQTRILTIRFDDLAGASNNASITLSSMALATSVEFPQLKICLGGFSVQSMALLTLLSVPELEYIGQNLGLGTYAAYVGTISFPKLKYVNGSMSMSSIGPVAAYSFPMLIGVNSSLSFSTSTTTTAINLSSLVFAANGMSVSGFTALTSLNFPALKFMGSGFTVTGNTLLNTFSAPALHTCNGSLTFTTNPALANFTLPVDGSLKVVMGAFAATSAVLTSASVDNIMQALGSLDGTSGTTAYSSGYTIDISGGSNAVPTPVSIATDYAGSAFTSSSGTCTVSRVGHGFITGDVLQISGVLTLTNANRYASITRVSDDVFTYTIVSQSNLSGTGTGIKVRKHNAYVKAIVTRGQTLTTNS